MNNGLQVDARSRAHPYQRSPGSWQNMILAASVVFLTKLPGKHAQACKFFFYILRTIIGRLRSKLVVGLGTLSRPAVSAFSCVHRTAPKEERERRERREREREREREVCNLGELY